MPKEKSIGVQEVQGEGGLWYACLGLFKSPEYPHRDHCLSSSSFTPKLTTILIVKSACLKSYSFHHTLSGLKKTH